MKPYFKNKVVVAITYKDFEKQLERSIYPSQYGNKEEFIECFTEYLMTDDIKEMSNGEQEEQLGFYFTVPTLYFDSINQRHETETLVMYSSLKTLESELSELYDHLKNIEERSTSQEIESDLQEIFQMGDELEELLLADIAEPRVYSEEHMLGETDERIARANAEELEDEKEQADPNTHLVHPTSSRTEEPLRTITYSDEMTTDDTPTPTNNKLEEVSKLVVVVCATLSLIFLTVILGIEAFHQVMSLF